MITSTNDILTALYGVQTTVSENPETGVVGITPVKILPNNPKRLGLYICNMSANVVYISPNNDVSNTKGVYLAPNGGSVTFKYIDDLSLVTRDFYAVASGAASSIYVLETVIYN